MEIQFGETGRRDRVKIMVASMETAVHWKTIEAIKLAYEGGATRGDLKQQSGSGKVFVYWHTISSEGKVYEVPVRERWWARTRWAVEDVLSEAEQQGIEITDEEAAAFLEDAESGIVQCIVQAGQEAINTQFWTRFCYRDENADPDVLLARQIAAAIENGARTLTQVAGHMFTEHKVPFDQVKPVVHWMQYDWKWIKMGPNGETTALALTDEGRRWGIEIPAEQALQDRIDKSNEKAEAEEVEV